MRRVLRTEMCLCLIWMICCLLKIKNLKKWAVTKFIYQYVRLQKFIQIHFHTFLIMHLLHPIFRKQLKQCSSQKKHICYLTVKMLVTIYLSVLCTFCGPYASLNSFWGTLNVYISKFYWMKKLLKHEKQNVSASTK